MRQAFERENVCYTLLVIITTTEKQNKDDVVRYARSIQQRKRNVVRTINHINALVP